MPVLGLVLTLVERDPREMARNLASLEALPGVELGELRGAKLPAVLETDSHASTDVRLAEIQRQPDVTHVDVVFAEFADLLPGHTDETDERVEIRETVESGGSRDT